MKKGYWILLISIMLVSIRFASASYQCSDGNSPTPCVCGHSPDSTKGYGQVLIGATIVSCNNIPDGVCPEDFQDPVSLTVANCGSCADPDCIGTISGKVYDAGASLPIAGAIVTSHPVKWNQSANLEQSSNPTGFDGSYSSFTVVTGTYYFSASKDSYDTQLIEATVTRNGATTLNFNLQNGTCHPDCTNSYNRCNAACDGTTFANGESCQFYNSTVANLCNNRFTGTEVYLGTADATHGWFIQCCGVVGSQAPYQKYYATAQTDTANVKNLIKTEKIAKYNDVPVRVIVAYWQQ